MSPGVLLTDFSGVYEAEGFLQWLQEGQEDLILVRLGGTPGTVCYCDREGEAAIRAALPGELPRLRWIDSGDYHYLSCLLAERETATFHLVLLDHHPDNQAPAFGGVLSCGSWVQALRERSPFLQDILLVGPPGCPEEVPEAWVEAHRGARVYLSLDLDILDRSCSRTDWSQGRYTMETLQRELSRLMDGRLQIIAVDVCGECPPQKGGSGEDLRINLARNKELHTFIQLKLLTNYV